MAEGGVSAATLGMFLATKTDVAFEAGAKAISVSLEVTWALA